MASKSEASGPIDAIEPYDDFEPVPPTMTPMEIATTKHRTRLQTAKKEYLFKVVVIGDMGTGKTSIVKRYTKNEFGQKYQSTIGVDYALKIIDWDEYTRVRVQLWDIAGSERLGSATRIYYKTAYGALIVCDITNKASFKSVMRWKKDLNDKVLLPDGSPIPCVLVLNKHDQRKDIIEELKNIEKVNKFVRDEKFYCHYFTSAKQNVNVTECITSLIYQMIENDQTIGKHPIDPEILAPAEIEQRRRGCRCS